MRSMNKALVVVILLQTLILAGQWLGAPTVATPAAAQDFNPGRDRTQMIDELRSMNTKLDRLVEILDSGELQVKATLPDEDKSRTPGR